MFTTDPCFYLVLQCFPSKHDFKWTWMINLHFARFLVQHLTGKKYLREILFPIKNVLLKWLPCWIGAFDDVIECTSGTWANQHSVNSSVRARKQNKMKRFWVTFKTPNMISFILSMQLLIIAQSSRFWSRKSGETLEVRNVLMHIEKVQKKLHFVKQLPKLKFLVPTL